jgi:hypothetical protein
MDESVWQVVVWTALIKGKINIYRQSMEEKEMFTVHKQDSAKVNVYSVQTRLSKENIEPVRSRK